MARPWERYELSYLRRLYGRPDWPLHELAGLFDRSEQSVKAKAAVLGLRARTPWSAGERAYVREHYGRTPAPAIAAHLGRPVGQVHQAAARLGVSRPRKQFTPGQEQVLRRRHAEGWSDAQIAAELGIDRRWLRERRAALGLPVNAAAVAEAKRRGVRTQLATLGLESPTQLRTRAYRLYARENGWPEDLRPREVQILNALAARGVPMTRRELAAAIGMRSDPREYSQGQRNILAGNGPGGSYPATLARRGLVTILWRAGPPYKAAGKGCGRRVNLYTLGPSALAILEERARCHAQTSPSSCPRPAS